MQQEKQIHGSPGITQPTIANNDANRSTNETLKWTSQAQRTSVTVKTEEPELDPIKNSCKRRRTASVNIRSSPSMPEKKTTDDSDRFIGLWRGNDVGHEAKQLLEDIEHRYPNTFQRVQIRVKTTWLTILKDLHYTIKSFMETSVDALTEEQITGFNEDFNELEGFGFDISWARKRLNMVDRLKFGKEPLQKEFMALEESLEPLKERVCGRWRQLMEAHDMWKKAQLEYDNAKDARDKKAQEMAKKFGDEFDRILKGHLGFGMLQGY
ncbi:hypothetical protein L2E82_27922 [Cichorium intybus]|uniref:Uncharacterized protein n=1 Tax=Cichorium intybus TaxID=13427 RepID=A0ACB9CUZ3_CICIN|nr:hypothetical protein L2E82_27922 [Cichorium intybus]